MALKLILFLQRKRRELGENTVCFTKKDESFILFLTVPNLLILTDVTTSADCFSAGFMHFTCKRKVLRLLSNLKTKRNYPLTHRYPDYPAEHPGKDYEEVPQHTLQGHFCLAGWLILNFSWIAAGKGRTAHTANLSFTRCLKHFKNSKHHLPRKHRFFRNSWRLHPGSL